MSKKDRYTAGSNFTPGFLKKQSPLEGLCASQLSSILGPPAEGHDEKTRREWVVRGPNGCVILLYDRNVDDETAKKWQIESTSSEHAKDFLKWLKEKL